jgi:hypothetical protein
MLKVENRPAEWDAKTSTGTDAPVVCSVVSKRVGTQDRNRAALGIACVSKAKGLELKLNREQ